MKKLLPYSITLRLSLKTLDIDINCSKIANFDTVPYSQSLTAYTACI